MRGGAFTISAQAIKFILKMGSTMVLARLLAPADFGLIAMITVITGFTTMFKEAGLTLATVQREHITHEQVSTLFWINVALSVVIMIIVALLSPVIAWFYGKPELKLITLVIAGTFIFSGLTVQHQALLRRQMRFKELAIIEILSMAAGVTIAITMALLGFGYWSLVGHFIGAILVNCCLVWMYSRWIPGRAVRGCGVRPMLAFGGGITSFNMMNYFTRNADNVIIGFALGSGPLGIYTKAYNLLMMPIRQFNGPVSSVMVPCLSRLQSDPDRYRRAYLRAISSLAFIGMPLVAFLFVVVDDAVLVILGPGWEAAATVFRWLAPAALLGTIEVAPEWLCKTLGRAKVQVIWAAISAPIIVGAFIIGAQWGIIGVATAFSISWCSMMMLFIVMSCYRSPVSVISLLFSIMPTLFAVFGAAAGCLVLAQIVDLNEQLLVVRLLVNTFTFGSLYLVLTLAVPSGRAQMLSLWTDGFASLSGRSSKDTA